MATPTHDRRSFLARLFLPRIPRKFAYQRLIKIVLRAVHVLCVGLLVGAHVFAAAPPAQEDWRLAAAASGLALLTLDLTETAAFIFQVRGIVVAMKISVLVALPWFGSAAPAVLATTFFAGVLISHAPSRVRYHMWIARDKAESSRERG